MKTLIERVQWLQKTVGTYDLEYTEVLSKADAVLDDVITALREQEARIEELEEDQRKGEFMVARERGRIEELETIVNCNSVNKMLATLQTENKHLDAALARYEQYFVGRSHACSGRDCVGFWQEPTGSLSRCNECTEVIELGKARAGE